VNVLKGNALRCVENNSTATHTHTHTHALQATQNGAYNDRKVNTNTNT
jgi:hypothetical protein